MCPSFMVTGDEEHSTRGRANALRLALSGSLPASELTGRKMYDTFDLCLQCKGCKAECPSNVDVAKLKAEFLHKFHAEHGVPLQARLMADIARLNRWGSALALIRLGWARGFPGWPRCCAGSSPVSIRAGHCRDSSAIIFAVGSGDAEKLPPCPARSARNVVPSCCSTIV